MIEGRDGPADQLSRAAIAAAELYVMHEKKNEDLYVS